MGCNADFKPSLTTKQWEQRCCGVGGAIFSWRVLYGWQRATWEGGQLMCTQAAQHH